MLILKPFSFIPHQLLLSISGALGLFVGLFGIGFLIGFHELGHFLFAKLFRVRTPSFSIGFGPRLITKQIGETEFSLSAIPLGGYVELAGAAEVGQGEQKEAQRDDEFSFKNKPFYQKFLIMFGGILFNLLFAYMALIFVFKIGIPQTPYIYPLNATPEIQQVDKESSADKAQIVPGDIIKTFNGKAITNIMTFLQEIAASPNSPARIEIEREGQNKEVNLTIGSKKIMGKEVGFLGITFKTKDLPALSFSDSIRQGINLANRVLFATFYAFKQIFAQKDVSQVRGPIFLISETAQGAAKGFQNFIIFLAIISINLAILNLIPLPILDGGQILFYGLEAITGRSIPVKVREYIFIATWLAFIALFIYLSYKDILSLFSKFWSK